MDTQTRARINELAAAKVENHPAIQTRMARALDIIDSGSVHQPAASTSNTRYHVTSQSRNGVYIVDLALRTCTCPDRAPAGRCKHVLAAWLLHTTRAGLVRQHEDLLFQRARLAHYTAQWTAEDLAAERDTLHLPLKQWAELHTDRPEWPDPPIY